MFMSIVAVNVLLFVAAPLFAAEEASFEKGIVISESNSITATVVAIDKKARTVRLKGPEGGLVDLKVSESAKNFDQVKKGDAVTLTYFGSLLLKRQKASGAPSSSETSVMQSVPKGMKPNVVQTDTLEGAVTIESINAKERTVTVRNQKGELKTHAIGENVKDFNKLKVGDQIYYSYTQVVALEVTSPQKKKKETQQPSGDAPLPY